MTVKTELLQLTTQAAEKIEFPPVRRVYLPEPSPAENKQTEFGMVELADGSAGLYYAWLGESQQGMDKRYAGMRFEGMPVMELVALFESEHEADCSLGMAAINAVTSSVFRRVGFTPDSAADSMAQLQIKPGDHIGMVGFFPSLVRRLMANGTKVTVIEKKQKFVQGREGVNVSLDPAGLRECNKVLITAATLLNNSIDEMLDHAAHAQSITILGPTAGFFPDPLFRRGVSALAGSEVLDTGGIIDNLRNGRGLGDATRKYIVEQDKYPGLKALLALK